MGYPASEKTQDGYLATLADLLMRYPMQVAVRACDPVHGIPRETRFLPTPADIVGWCERETKPLYEESAREDRINQQLRARDEWLNAPTDQRLAEKCAAWLTREDKAAQQLSGETPGNSAARIEASRKAAASELSRRIGEVASEWTGQAPTIAGVPISRELSDKLNEGEQDAA